MSVGRVGRLLRAEISIASASEISLPGPGHVEAHRIAHPILHADEQPIDRQSARSAKAWGLHATMSLARLLAKLGCRDEARTMLTDIYNWFTEGFDTADLKDAKALLDQLAT
jgi:predicted ATPase